MKNYLQLFYFLFFAHTLFAQISISPLNPKASQQVTITYDASLGNAELLGSSSVYMHSGVVLDKPGSTKWSNSIGNWGEDDGIGQMTAIGNNKWQITITPQNYYGTNNTDNVFRLAMVFRNADGTLIGKTSANGDFYVETNPGFYTLFTSPNTESIFVKTNETYTLKAVTPSNGTLSIYIDDELKSSQSNTTVIQYGVLFSTAGNHIAKIIATDGITTKENTVEIFVTENSQTQALPSGMKDGINYLSDTSVLLNLLAPGKDYVHVTGTFNNWAIENQYQLKKTPDGERFWIQLDNLTKGQDYIFQYIIDGTLRIADPFADQIADPWNDQYIPNETYPNLISYTDGEKGIASVFKTGQEKFQWQIENFKGVQKNELMIYELLIRDFTTEHSYQSVSDSIPYLKELGINAIELLPFNEFEGNESWGYNPSFFFASDKYYGHKNDLKNLIDTAHKNGIAIIMDMVLNHAFGQNVMAQMYWDDANNKPAWNNPWFNQDAPNTSYSWGSDFNHESQYTKDFMDKVTRYWQEEYKVDGFRFDFTKGFTNTVGDGWAYDASRISILKRMSDRIWDVNPNAYVILEHLADENEERELSAYGMLPWKRVDEQYKEVISGHQLNEAHFGGAQNNGKVIYMESHDEERIMVQNLKYGKTDGSYNIKDLSTALDRVEMGAAFLYTVPGPKMIWMFGEQGYDYSINHGGRVSNKPIVWEEYMSDPNRRDVYNVFSKLLNLRKNHPVFTQGFFTWDEIGATRQIKITHETLDVVIIANFGTSTTSITPDFPHHGTWYNYFNGQEYNANGENYTLAAGQWELFTSKKIDDSAILAPTNLSATVDNANIQLTWQDQANNETAYTVERASENDLDFTVVATLPPNTTHYTDTNLSDNKYYYRVQATTNLGKSDYSNPITTVVGEIEGFTVYFKDTENWNNVYVHYWNEVPDVLPASNWPGIEMSPLGDGWYTYTFEGIISTQLLFSKAGSEKTIDLSRSKNGWYDNGVWFDTDPREPIDLDPVLTANILGGTFEKGEEINFVLSATDDKDLHPNIYYTLDGSVPTANDTLYTGSIIIKEDVTVKAIAFDNLNQGSSVGVFTFSFHEPTDGLTIHFKPNTYTNPTLYFWNTSPVTVNTTWPGLPMQAEEDGWYAYTLEGVDCADFIFSDNGNSQSIDFNRCVEGWYENGIWYNAKPETSLGLTVHFKKPSHWSTVNLYYWNVSPTMASATWPGIPMLAGQDGWYSYTIENAISANLIFSDNGSSQTENLFRDKEGWYDNGWSDNGAVNKQSESKLGKIKPVDFYQNYPNPVTNKLTTIQFYLPESTTVTVKIADVTGKIISVPIYKDYKSGEHKIILHLDGVAKGIYLMQFETTNFSKTKRLIIL